MITVDVTWQTPPGVDDGEWTVVVRRADRTEVLPPYTMSAWTDAAGARMPCPGPDAPPPAVGAATPIAGPVDLAALFEQVEQNKKAERLVEYGQHLFRSLLGPAAAAIDAEVGPKADAFQIALRWQPDDAALHRRLWDAMHDGHEFITRRAARTIVTVRVVPGLEHKLRVVTHVPRILFAIGSKLTERDVRAGAEVMGVLRGVERRGNTAAIRVVADCSVMDLQDAVNEFKPDIVHIIGHGEFDQNRQTGTIQLRTEDNHPEPATASEIAIALRGAMPAAVFVSACQTATAHVDAGVPLAADLIRSGVPLTLAMGGDVSDRGCRAFTRFVAAAIGRSQPLSVALAKGRAAAFATAPTTDSVDWAMPALFASEPLPDGYHLVQAAESAALLTLAADLGLIHEPVFAGRREFIDAFEDVMRTSRSVVLTTSRPKEQGSKDPTQLSFRYGGSRLLRELGFIAFRRGHVVLKVGPCQTSDRPKHLGQVFSFLVTRSLFTYAKHAGADMNKVVKNLTAALGAPTPGAALNMLEEDWTNPGVFELLDVVDGLWKDVAALRAKLSTLNLADAAARPLLFFDDVHLYPDALQPLLDLITANGLVGTAGSFGVVLFAKETESDAPVDRLGKKIGGGGTTFYRRLQSIAQLDDEEQMLTFVTWLTHRVGPDGEPLPSLTRFASDKDTWFSYMSSSYGRGANAFWDPDAFTEFCQVLVDNESLCTLDDGSILTASEL